MTMRRMNFFDLFNMTLHDDGNTFLIVSCHALNKSKTKTPYVCDGVFWYETISPSTLFKVMKFILACQLTGRNLISTISVCMQCYYQKEYFISR